MKHKSTFSMAVWMTSLLLLLPMHVAAEITDTGLANPQVRVCVGEQNRVSGSFDVEQWHAWYVYGEIPEQLPEMEQYSIILTLPHGLVWEPESLAVSMALNPEGTILLERDTHFTLVTGSEQEMEYRTERIGISLTPEGLRYISPYRKLQPQLRIAYRAYISTDAEIGQQMVCTAHLNCTGIEQVSSNKAAVSTGGAHIHLSDPAGRSLAGGSFMVARPAGEAERKDPAYSLELLDTPSGPVAVIYETFYGEESMTGPKVSGVTTDETGEAVIYGLSYGSYYLVQTEAPEGTVMQSFPLKLEIGEVSHLTAADGWKDSDGTSVDKTVLIVNSCSTNPETGDLGKKTIQFCILLLLMSASTLICLNRKREYR